MSATIPYSAIVEAVASEFQVPVNAVLSPRRQADIVIARFAGYWLARQLTQLSLPQIGRLTGRRDHTGVMHGLSRIDARLESDPAFARRLHGLRRRLEAA